MKNTVIAITGATASGKTKLAVELAKRIDAEIISCDSRQIYKEFDIATAKPSAEEQQGIKHHLLGFVSPEKIYSANDFCEDAKKIISEIQKRGKNVIVVGGTGFYFRILLEGLSLTGVKPNKELRDELTQLAQKEGKEAVYKILEKLDSKAASRIHQNNLDKVIRAIEISKELNKPMSETGVNFKPEYDVLWLGVDFKNRQNLYDRINLRVEKMRQDGLEKEARNLFEKYGEIPTLMNTIGYQEFVPYFKGEIKPDEVFEKIKQNTRRYAKRQLTWFRANDKIHWFFNDEQSFDEILNGVLNLYK